ncbi:MAG: response regulator [Lachnospiraceae bacterium]|nr:response regulator [Lachnospiraceae bacterium]
MYNFLLVIQLISLVVLFGEGLYVFFHLNSRMHSFLFLYLIANIANQAGYLFEMTAKTSEEAYLATRLLYLGKVFIPIGMIIFILHFCRINIPQWLSALLISLHALMWMVIATNDYHHLFYSTITFVNSGMFPHNSYGHGPLYFIYQATSPIYAIIDIVFAIKLRKEFQRNETKRHFLIFILAPLLPLIGFVFFLFGVTNGYDTTNLGFFLASILLMCAFFRFDLIDTEDMFRNRVIDSLNDGILATGYNGKLVYYNNRARGLFPGMLVAGKTDENSGIIKDLRNKAERKERIKIGDCVYGIVVKEVVRDDLFTGRLYILDDVTDSVKYTKQLEEEKERANAANEAKSRFLSNMSHEIRTPMNAIVGMTDIILRDELPDSDKEYLENIRNSGNALIDIINDILDFSKIESGRMEIMESPYEPLTLVNDLKMIFITRIGDKPLRLNYDIDYKLPARLMGDQVRIRQIIINLVNNAIKFTEVGYVRLKVSADRVSDDEIKLNISVKDSGLGIREEDMERLFDSFTQVDSIKNHSKEGTGLGLTITKQLVELMGGKISVESAYGSGSEFFVTIPQKIVDETPATEFNYQKEDKENVHFIAPEAEILVAEDNEINVKVIMGLLEPLKMNIDVAENGLTALRKITDRKYDLVLMDHMMPVMDGLEATSKIRERGGEYYEKLPIIALTANAVQGAREELLSAGMNDYVMKPVDIDELKYKIRKWLPADLVIDVSPEEYAAAASDDAYAGTLAGTDSGNKDNERTGAPERDLGEKESDYGYLDREIGLKHCGSESLYNEVLRDFYKLIDNKAGRIEALYNENNLDEYTIEVHALKSVARMVGAEYLSGLALELEMAGKEENRALIDEKTPELLDRYRAYKQTLSYFDAEDNTDKSEVSKDEIIEKLNAMKEAASTFDIDTVDEMMEVINGFKMPDEELEGMIKDLDALVRDVSYDDVTRSVDEIISKL